MRISRFNRIVAAFTIFFFSWQTANAYSSQAFSVIPKAYANVESNPPKPGTRNVLLLLNAHTSSDAQKNISNLLSYFQSQGIDLIGLEGADDKIDGEIFREFPHKNALAKAAWQLVKEGVFTGAEYFYITADKLPEFYGLEDKSLYLEDRDAFVKTIQAKENLKPALIHLVPPFKI